MSRTPKYKINVSEEQLDKFYKALHVGSPLNVALSFAGISKTTYILWIEIASVVRYCKEMDMLKEEADILQTGIDMSEIKQEIEQANANTGNSQITVSAYKKPNGESILRYRNNLAYQKYADEVFEIIQKCDSLRSEIVLYHLTAIRDGARTRASNTNASQWFLERTLPDVFGKNDPTKTDIESITQTKEVKIEFIDPDSNDSIDRVRRMEQQVEEQLNGSKSKA